MNSPTGITTSSGANRCGIKEGNILQVFWEAAQVRHPGRAGQDGDDRDGIAYRRLQLETDEISLVIYFFAAASAGTEPALADNDQ